MTKNIVKIFLIILPIALVIAYAHFYLTRRTTTITPPPKPVTDITTFEECAAAGYPIRESYPESCTTPDGRSFTRVTTDEVPTPITITGSYNCLPKVDTGGGVTLECGFGLQTKDGYYALDMTSVLSDNYPMLTGGETITVEGVLVPKAMLSVDRWRTYDVIGVISVEKMTKK